MTRQQEKVYFDTLGYLVKRQLFSAEEMTCFSSWYNANFDKHIQQTEHATSQMAYPGVALHEGFCRQYLEDDRILDTLENLMGEGYIFLASDAQRFAGNTRWHQDTIIPMEDGSDGEYLMVKAIMYLDDLSDGQGSLCLLPGSHHRDYAEAVRPVMEGRIEDTNAITPAGMRPMEYPGAIDACTRPGDIVFFNSKMAHSSWGGSNNRRYFGLSFGSKPTKDWHFQWLHYHQDKCREMFMGGEGSHYPPHLVQGISTRLQTKIEPMLSWGY